MITLRRGSVGAEVRRWQAIVGAKVDGDFGEKTEALTRAWQKAHQLEPDGVVGRATWEAAGHAPTVPPPPSGPLVRQVVVDRFFDENVPLEGLLNRIYGDQAADPTISAGCWLGTPAAAIALPFRRADGSLATAAEVEVDWRAIKGNRRAANLGAFASYTKGLVKLHLDEQAMRDLVRKRLLENVDYVVKHRLPNFPQLNANAQTAYMLWCWGPGAASPAPKMDAALAAEEYAIASAECKLDETGNAGLIKRNARMEKLMLGAVTVKANSLDPDEIFEEP